MKNGKLVLMVLVWVLGGLLFTSCDKEEEPFTELETIKYLSANGLNKTIWEGKNETTELRILFYIDDCFLYSKDLKSGESETLYPKYNYKDFSVILNQLEIVDNGLRYIEGSIKGNSMDLKEYTAKIQGKIDMKDLPILNRRQ